MRVSNIHMAEYLLRGS